MRSSRKTPRRFVRAAAPKLHSHDRVELTGTATVALKAADGQTAKTPTFSMMLYSGGTMNLGWGRPVIIDLAGLKAAEPITALMNHDRSAVVGQSTRVQIDGSGVRVEGIITGDTEDKNCPAGMVVGHARNGFQWPTSNGTAVEKLESIDAGQKCQVNGKEFYGPLYVVRAGTLREASFVSIGADQLASAQVAASAAKESIMDEFKKWLTAHAIDFDSLSEARRATLQAQFDADPASTPKAEEKPAPKKTVTASGEKTASEIKAEAIVEQHRIDAIREVCGDKHGAIAAQAIAEDWPVLKAENAVLKASRPKAPAAHTPAAPERGQQFAMLEAAAVLRGPEGSEVAKKAYKPELLEAADKQYKGSFGLGDLLIEAACANGFTGRARHVNHEVLQAAFSTADIGGILSNIANKFLLKGFFSVENTWRQICAIRAVNDFKTVTSYRLTGSDQYDAVAPGGQLKHGTLGADTYTNKADTYGKLLTVDRRDIVNDDLGAITTVPQKLGRGSGLKVNDVFWTAFMANSAFFVAGNKNYYADAAAVLGIDSLSYMVALFDALVDSDGKPTGIAPKILLTPPVLSPMAMQLQKSVEIRDTTASTKYPTANPHQGQYTPLKSRYLANSKYTGYSATAWYLLADPADLPVIEVAFLHGQEAPVIETAAADFNVLGIQMRGYHDFGVALQDPRGGCKSKGGA